MNPVHTKLVFSSLFLSFFASRDWFTSRSSFTLIDKCFKTWVNQKKKNSNCKTQQRTKETKNLRTDSDESRFDQISLNGYSYWRKRKKENGIQRSSRPDWKGLSANSNAHIYSIVKASSHNTLEKYLVMRWLLITIGYGCPIDLSFFLELYQKRYAVIKNRD